MFTLYWIGVLLRSRIVTAQTASAAALWLRVFLCIFTKNIADIIWKSEQVVPVSKVKNRNLAICALKLEHELATFCCGNCGPYFQIRFEVCRLPLVVCRKRQS
jgi:hypothetical protein